MTIHLYRYPHPTIPDRWIYVGQGANRDKRHRSGQSSFGRRFIKAFPDTPLPTPTRWTEPATNHLEANNAETAAMFKYHTWHGYLGGMNLTLPGSKDYEKMGHIGGSIGGRRAFERRSGIFGFTLNQLSERGRKGGKLGGITQGRINAANSHMARIQYLGAFLGNLAQPRQAKALGGRMAGRINCCLRWNINRGKPCVCGRHNPQ